MKQVLAVVIALLFSIIFISPTFAEDSLESRQRDIGLFGGVIFPGTINIDWGEDDIDLDTQTGFMLKAYFDQFVSPVFGVGIYAQYVSTTLEYEDLEADADMYEFGFGFKTKFMISPAIALKPGLEIGYRKSDRESLAPGDDETDADGLAINVAAEIQFMFSNGYIFSLMPGFITQPVGGNDDTDVTWAPIIYLMAGIVF
jgi:hypothetical protein